MIHYNIWYPIKVCEQEIIKRIYLNNVVIMLLLTFIISANAINIFEFILPDKNDIIYRLKVILFFLFYYYFISFFGRMCFCVVSNLITSCRLDNIVYYCGNIVSFFIIHILLYLFYCNSLNVKVMIENLMNLSLFGCQIGIVVSAR